jgi:four helix bundle protein
LVFLLFGIHFLFSPCAETKNEFQKGERTMLKNFRTYQLAVQFYQEVKKLDVPSHLKDQLLRASSSIALNLAEGCAKPTIKDRKRYYAISLGSLRECEAIFDLMNMSTMTETTGHLGACLYKLSRYQP